MSKQPKKKLLVKSDELIAEPIKAEIVEPLDVPIVVEDSSLQAPKVDKRGKHPNVMNNLEKGREKLKAIRAEKKVEKDALVEKAVQKKIAIKERVKKQVMEDYGLDDLDSLPPSDEEEDVIIPKKKTVKVVHSIAPSAPKPKNKPIRYVEESDSEEEEVVYIKRSAKPAQIVPKGPQLIFY